jgi:hypothetical protein
MLARGLVQMGGIPSRGAGPGDILASGEVISALAADANSTITGAMIAGGILNRTGMTAGRTDTTDTAHATLVALGGNDFAANVLPGVTFRFIYRQSAAFLTTWAHGRGWVAGIGTLNVTASLIRTFLCKVLNSTPEVVLTAATIIATPDVTLAVPAAPGTITPGMLVSAAAGITAGTRVAGVHYGSTANRDNTDKIVRVTLDQNAITASDPAKSITFSPMIEINGLGEQTL